MNAARTNGKSIKDITDLRDAVGRERLLETIEAKALTIPVTGQQGAAAEADDFPRPPAKAAFHGVAGDIVAALAPETEAQTAAMLIHLLTAIGNIVGRDAYTVAGGVRHHFNLFSVVVGATSRARKGTAWAAVQPIVGGEYHPGGLDPHWRDRRVKNGLSSGEGVKWFVRDPFTKPGEDEPTDLGETDKRLFVIEEEFSGVLQMGRREGNTLSTVLRQAWDGKKLGTLTKTDPITATGAHISIIGHITREELRSLLSRSDAFNGFGNRFLWLASKRAQLLPEGGRLDHVNVAPLLDRLKAARTKARGELRRDDEAANLWAKWYARTAQVDVPGVVGAVTNRGEAQVLRLSGLYALLDQSSHIGVAHLNAALALWDYCERSARWIFGVATGSADADAILAALTRRGAAGMTQTEINAGVFQRNAPANRIAAALKILAAGGLVHNRSNKSTGGAPSHRWFAGSTTNETDELNEATTAELDNNSLNSSNSYHPDVEEVRA